MALSPSSLAILLTAAIQVGDPKFVKRNNTQTRLRDYQGALTKWLTAQSSVSRIILCDNSGYSLDELVKTARNTTHNKQTDFLSFRFDNYQGRGYGWGEVHIYEYALQHSRLLATADYLMFCSGRRFVRNVDDICKQLPTSFDFISNWTYNMSWVDGDFFIVRTPVFVQEFLPQLKLLIDDSVKMYQERALARIMHNLMARDFRWYPFARYPLYEGIMGQKNIAYWQRKEGYLLFNLFSSWISSVHYRFNRTIINNQNKPHQIDRL